MSNKYPYTPINDWKQAQEICVRERFGKKKKPLTENHIRYKQAILENKYIICTGYAGCGKTYLACEVGVSLVREGRLGKIIITRPLVECGGKVGFLPGDVDEKTAPYLAPMTAALKEILTEKEFEAWKLAGKIVIYPMEYMRGSTHTDCMVIVDEAQNAEYEQLRMVMTRLGENCIMVINGDTTQNDLKYRSPLIRVCECLGAPPCRRDIAFISMERKDCLRPEIIQFIDERLAEGSDFYEDRRYDNQDRDYDDYDAPLSYGQQF